MIVTRERAGGLLLADGSKAFLIFPGQPRGFLISGAIMTSLSVTENFDRSTSIGIELLSCHCQIVAAEQAMSMFRNVEGMSVNDLLAEAFRKMEQRST